MPTWIVLLIVSPFVGSFIGVIVSRDAEFARIARGRSHCDSCAAVLRPLDLVPLVNWLVLKARCRACGARISWFYPAIEIAAILVVAWAAIVQSGIGLVLSSVLGWFLIALAAIDLRTFRLPDVLTLPLIALGLISAWFYDAAGWSAHLIGAAGAFLAFAAVGLVYHQLRGRQGMGLGDAKLAAGLGAFVGWQGMPGTVLIAGVLALVAVLIRIVRYEKIPFGPFLAIGGWITWLYGPLSIGPFS